MFSATKIACKSKSRTKSSLLSLSQTYSWTKFSPLSRIPAFVFFFLGTYSIVEIDLEFFLTLPKSHIMVGLKSACEPEMSLIMMT